MRVTFYAWAVAACTVACMTDYQKGLDDPRYGNANALANEVQPGTDAGSIICTESGGTLVDGGTCRVSFAKDVLPALFRSTCANVACHGGSAPQNAPRIDPQDPGAMWSAFSRFKMSAGNLPYINPCSTDKTKAGIACNLHATETCGVKMPQGGPQMDQSDLDKIELWLGCGSPNN
jgi:predicted CxxxxCH...CXXCH cytochrome family protein